MSNTELTPELIRIRARHAELSTEEWGLRQRANGLRNGRAWEWTNHIRDERLVLERERVAELERIMPKPVAMPEPILMPSQWCMVRMKERGQAIDQPFDTLPTLDVVLECLDWMAERFATPTKRDEPVACWSQEAELARVRAEHDDLLQSFHALACQRDRHRQAVNGMVPLIEAVLRWYAEEERDPQHFTVSSRRSVEFSLLLQEIERYRKSVTHPGRNSTLGIITTEPRDG